MSEQLDIDPKVYPRFESEVSRRLFVRLGGIMLGIYAAANLLGLCLLVLHAVPIWWVSDILFFFAIAGPVMLAVLLLALWWGLTLCSHSYAPILLFLMVIALLAFFNLQCLGSATAAV